MSTQQDDEIKQTITHAIAAARAKWDAKVAQDAIDINEAFAEAIKKAKISIPDIRKKLNNTIAERFMNIDSAQHNPLQQLWHTIIIDIGPIYKKFKDVGFVAGFVLDNKHYKYAFPYEIKPNGNFQTYVEQLPSVKELLDTLEKEFPSSDVQCQMESRDGYKTLFIFIKYSYEISGIIPHVTFTV